MSDRYRVEPWYNMWCIKDADNPTWVSPLNLPDDVDKATARDIAALVVARLEGRTQSSGLDTASMDELFRTRDSLRRELERWKRGQCVEGDYICENGDVVDDPWAERDALRAELEALRAAARDYIRASYDVGACDELARLRALLTPEVPHG